MIRKKCEDNPKSKQKGSRGQIYDTAKITTVPGCVFRSQASRRNAAGSAGWNEAAAGACTRCGASDPAGAGLLPRQ